MVFNRDIFLIAFVFFFVYGFTNVTGKGKLSPQSIT